VSHGYGAGEQLRAGEQRFGGMSVPDPQFAQDDGTVAPEVAEVLARYQAGRADDVDVVAVLAATRFMAPLVAVLDSVLDADDDHSAGPGPGEKDSHMATVSLVSPDGRRGMLAFTSVQSMAAWDPDARGIPASAARVASAALEEGADAVLVDLGGPVRFALQGEALRAVAEGRPWTPAFADAAVRAAVVAALADLPGLSSADLVPPPAGADVESCVLLACAPGVDADALAQGAAERLAASDEIARRVPGGLAVAVLDAP